MKTKRVFMILLVLMLFPTFVLAHADDSMKQYRVEEAGLYIELPENMVALTNTSTIEELALFGLSPDDWQIYIDNGVYLDAVRSNGRAFEVRMIITDDNAENIRDYNRFTDDELLESIKDGASTVNANSPSNISLNFEHIIIYTHSQAKFVVTPFIRTEGDSKTYGISYLTIYGSKNIEILFSSEGGRLSDADQTLARKIIDSICFDMAPDTSPIPLVQFNPGSYTFYLVVLIVVIAWFFISSKRKKAMINRRYPDTAFEMNDEISEEEQNP